MITLNDVREWSQSFPGVVEVLHFEKHAFRTPKAIFCSVSEAAGTAVLKLYLIDQSVFCDLGSELCHPVPGGWGRKGYTVFVMANVSEELFRDGLGRAYAGGS